MRDYRVIISAICLVLVSPVVVRACGFIETAANVATFHKDAAVSQWVVYGHLEDARETAPGEGTTKLVISAVIKADPVLDGRKVVTIPRYLQTGDDPKKPVHYLCFAEAKDGRHDLFRGVPATEAVVDYLKGLMSLDAKDRPKVLRYCAGYLEHQDREIAADAFAEFMQSPDKAIAEAAKDMSAKALRGWVRDKGTSLERLRLYGYLLGSCGGDEDAKVLREVLDRVTKEDRPGLIDGVLTGYTLLKREEGWAYVRGLISAPKATFSARFSCLRASRYFHITQPDFLAEKDVLAVMSAGLDQGDLADLAINYLRDWKCWKLTGRILSLYGKESHDLPIVKRSILLYALQCPGAEAAEFVASRRKTDREMVNDMEETLRLMEESAAPKK
jgi:hypothetical protein